MRKIDRRFSSNGRIDHCEQACGHLYEFATSHVGCGGKAGEVANDATAKRYHEVIAGEFRLGAVLKEECEFGHVLNGLVRLYDVNICFVPSGAQRLENSSRVKRSHIGVRYDHGSGATGGATRDFAHTWQQPRCDVDVVRPR